MSQPQMQRPAPPEAQAQAMELVQRARAQWAQNDPLAPTEGQLKQALGRIFAAQGADVPDWRDLAQAADQQQAQAAQAQAQQQAAAQAQAQGLNRFLGQML